MSSGNPLAVTATAHERGRRTGLSIHTSERGKMEPTCAHRQSLFSRNSCASVSATTRQNSCWSPCRCGSWSTVSSVGDRNVAASCHAWPAMLACSGKMGKIGGRTRASHASASLGDHAVHRACSGASAAQAGRVCGRSNRAHGGVCLGFKLIARPRRAAQSAGAHPWPPAPLRAHRSRVMQAMQEQAADKRRLTSLRPDCPLLPPLSHCDGAGRDRPAAAELQAQEPLPMACP